MTRLVLIALLAAIQLAPSSAQSTVLTQLAKCLPDANFLHGTLYGCSYTSGIAPLIACLKKKENQIKDNACLAAVNKYIADHPVLELGAFQGCAGDVIVADKTLYGCSITDLSALPVCLQGKIGRITDSACSSAVNAYVAHHSGLVLGDLQGCASDVNVTEKTLYGCPIADLSALSVCLQGKTDQINNNICLDSLSSYIADHDSEVAHRGEETDDEKTAEDEICDAKLAAACQKEFYVASFTGDSTSLKRCAMRHINVTGHTCIAMLQNASTDGLMTHMSLCVAKAVKFCPTTTGLVGAQIALGLKSLEGPTLSALVACLKNHTEEMQQGCAGFYQSVSGVVKDIGDKASDQFNDDKNTVPAGPSPSPAVPAGPSPSPPDGHAPRTPGKHQTPGHAPRTPGNHQTPGKVPDDSGKPTSPPPTDNDNSGLSGGAIAGIVVSCLVVVAAAGAGVWFWRKRVAYANLNSMMGLAQGNALPQMEVGFETSGKSDYERVMMA